MADSGRQRQVRARRRSPAALTSQTALDEGDGIEIAFTAAVKHPRKGEFWVKAGATSTVRQGESPEDARDRVGDFVLDTLNEGIGAVFSQDRE